eukprot:18537-Eustigmatos_ZCMA.PRE.1
MPSSPTPLRASLGDASTLLVVLVLFSNPFVNLPSAVLNVSDVAEDKVEGIFGRRVKEHDDDAGDST